MTSWRVAFRRIGGPDAVTWPLFWITFASNLIGHFVTPGQTDATPGVRLLAVACSQVALFVPLLIARSTVMRDAAHPHPWWAVTAFVVAIFTRTAVMAWVLHSLAGVTSPPYLARVMGVFFQLFLTLLITALVVSAQRAHARDLGSLEQVRRGIDLTMTRVLGKVEKRNEEAVRGVTRILEQELAVLDVTADDEAVETLQRLASDVVRPMSHELASVTPDWAEAEFTAPPAHVGWAEAARALGLRGHFLPAPTAAVIALIMLVPSLIYFPGARWAVLGASALGTFLAFTIANAILRRILPLSTSRRSLAFVGLVAAVAGAVPAGLAGLAVRGLSGHVLALGGTVFVSVSALMIALISALLLEQQRVEGELEASTQQLRANLVRLHQIEWYQQKSLSRALHGPVQSAVTAAALRLDGAMRAGTSSPELVNGVRDSLRRAIDVLQVSDLPPVPLHDFFENLTGTWDGVCAVEVDIDDETGKTLSEDLILRSIVTDAVIEAVSNSVRHAHAQTAALYLRRLDDRTLVLRVTNDGTPSGDRTDAGMGSRILDECALSWDLEAREAGWCLEVLFPTGFAQLGESSPRTMAAPWRGPGERAGT